MWKLTNIIWFIQQQWNVDHGSRNTMVPDFERLRLVINDMYGKLVHSKNMGNILFLTTVYILRRTRVSNRVVYVDYKYWIDSTGTKQCDGYIV